MTGRSVKEWIGATPNAKIPPRVRLRVWERERGICHLSGRKIGPGEPWDLDHKVALTNGGEHRESNLFPALRDKHREKTKEDVAEKSRVADLAKSHIGAKRAKQTIKSANTLRGPEKARDKLPMPDRRPMFEDIRRS